MIDHESLAAWLSIGSNAELYAKMLRSPIRTPYARLFVVPRDRQVADDLYERLPLTIRCALIFGAMSMGAPIFAVDPEIVTQSARSAGLLPGDAYLPPLPFDSIVIETHGDTDIACANPDDMIPMRVMAIKVDEIVQGEQWKVWAWVESTADDTIGSLYQVDRTVEGTYINGELCTDHAIGQFAFAAVDLIQSRDVEHVMLPRQERRRFERETGTQQGQAWIVRLRSDHGDATTSSGRRYTCKWWVRGHWRHFVNGKRTFVRAYVKGHAADPWRDPEHPVRVV